MKDLSLLLCVYGPRGRESCGASGRLVSALPLFQQPSLISAPAPPLHPPPLHPSTPPQRRQLGPCPVSTINLLPSLSLSLFLSFASTLAFFHSLNLPLLHIFLSLSFFHSLSLFLSLSFSLFCFILYIFTALSHLGCVGLV